MIRSTNAVDPPRRPVTWIAATCTVLSALSCTCHDPSPRGTTPGELGKGTFSYRCVDETDGACAPDVEKPADFPTLIAVGGRFGMVYEPLEEGPPVELGSPTSHLAFDGVTFTALAPGWAAIVAYDGDQVLDLLHVEVIEPSSLQIIGDGAPMTLGEERVLEVYARTDDGTVCAGALPYEWSLEPPGVLELAGALPNDRVRVIAVAPGEAGVTVTEGEIAALFDLEVLPGEAETGATGSTADTGSAP